MSNYLNLTKLFIRSLRLNKYNKKGKKLSLYTLILLSILFFLIPILIFYTLFIYQTMNDLNEVDFAFQGFQALLYLILIFSFIFSFNVVINELYFSEDIDNILSLPIKSETIVASKFTSFYIIENIILFVFIILSSLAYILSLDLSIWNLLLSIIGIIFIPVVPMVLCSVIVQIVFYLLKNYLNSKTIKKIEYTLIIILIILSFFLLWKLSSFNFESYIERFALGDHTFLNIMNYIFPHIYFFIKGLEGSIIYMIISVIISLIYFIIMMFISNKLYYDGVVEIRNKDTESKKTSHNIITNFEIKKPINNYYLKDIKMIFRSPTFFINCIIINIIWPIFILLLFKISLPDYSISFMQNEIISRNPIFIFRLLLIVIGISIIVTAFNSLASSAFSREGKNYYFIKYIPIKYGIQWREKYLISFIISFIGIIIYEIPFFIIIHLPIMLILLNIILTVLSISFVSLLGLLIDSAFPKLVWDDESDSLRENYNTFISMGYSLLLFIFICGGGYYLFKRNLITLPIFVLVSLLILIIGNIILYIISDKRISKNIIKQEI